MWATHTDSWRTGQADRVLPTPPLKKKNNNNNNKQTNTPLLRAARYIKKTKNKDTNVSPKHMPMFVIHKTDGEFTRSITCRYTGAFPAG